MKRYASELYSHLFRREVASVKAMGIPINRHAITQPTCVAHSFFFSKRLDSAALKFSLSQVLQKYHIMSGRVKHELNKPFVKLGDNGVEFITHDVRHSYKEFIPTEYPFSDKCFPPAHYYETLQHPMHFLSGKRAPISIRLVQYTDGSCLTVAFQNMVLDGVAVFNLMNDWSRIHGGKEVSEIKDPNFDRWTFNFVGSDAPKLARKTNALLNYGKFFMTWRSSTKVRYELSTRDIETIKSKIKESMEGNPLQNMAPPKCTTEDLITAAFCHNMAKSQGKIHGNYRVLRSMNLRHWTDRYPKDWVGRAVGEYSTDIDGEMLRQSGGPLAEEMRRNLQRFNEKWIFDCFGYLDRFGIDTLYTQQITSQYGVLDYEHNGKDFLIFSQRRNWKDLDKLYFEAARPVHHDINFLPSVPWSLVIMDQPNGCIHVNARIPHKFVNNFKREMAEFLGHDVEEEKPKESFFKVQLPGSKKKEEEPKVPEAEERSAKFEPDVKPSVPNIKIEVPQEPSKSEPDLPPSTEKPQRGNMSRGGGNGRKKK